MKTLAIYPFSQELSPIVRYAEQLIEYKSITLLSPKSFGFDGLDVGEIDGGTPLGISVTHNSFDTIPQSDALLIDYHPRIKNPLFYQDIVKHFANNGKEILLTKKLAQFINIKEEDGYKILGNKTTQLGYIDYKKGLREIDVPVITVYGTGNMTNKFEIQLAIRKFFTQKGYKVSQWGTKDYSSLFGFPDLPEFITGNASLEDRILYLNHYIYNAVEREKPDIIIIGAPGGIMKYNQYIFNNFGEHAFIIANAVRADIAVLSLYFNYYKLDYFDMMNNYCRYGLNSDVQYFNISNCKTTFNNEKKELNYLTMNSSFVMEKIDEEVKQNKDFSVFNVFEENTINLICSDIELKLAENTALV